MATAIQWRVFVDENDPEKIPHLVIEQAGSLRIPTLEESERAARLLNEEGVNVVRIFCKTEGCKGKGSWIERPKTGKAGIDRNVYHCELCHRPMER